MIEFWAFFNLYNLWISIADELCDVIGRVQVNTNKRFDKIDTTLESMQHEINACKMERESLSILIKKIDQLEKRLDELERRIA